MARVGGFEAEVPYGGYGSGLAGLDGHAARFGGAAAAPLQGGQTVMVPASGDPVNELGQEIEAVGTQHTVPLEVDIQYSAPTATIKPAAPQPVPMMMVPAPVPVAAPCPAPVRWVCFKRINKLIFFGVLFIIAAITIILLFVIDGQQLQIAIIVLMVLVAVLMIIEYLWLGTDCAVNPATGSITCKNKLV